MISAIQSQYRVSSLTRRALTNQFLLKVVSAHSPISEASWTMTLIGTLSTLRCIITTTTQLGVLVAPHQPRNPRTSTPLTLCNGITKVSLNITSPKRESILVGRIMSTCLSAARRDACSTSQSRRALSLTIRQKKASKDRMVRDLLTYPWVATTTIIATVALSSMFHSN